ncbi:MAG TPA: hypothetical protein VEQ60_07320, partial [Longimicrobium sp.]|nr:hypothetical protein [Longimicrobium sp.]
RVDDRAARADFNRAVMEQALTFMRHDNAIVGNFATITGALAGHFKENPARALATVTRPASAMEGGIAGGDFLGDLFGAITQIVVEDKKFFLDLIKEVLT